jgi:membrane-associated phospholipid phosphatase
MVLLKVRPTKTDEKVAREVAAHTDRRIERGAEVVTWAADEHLLVGVAGLGWLISRRSKEPTYRLFADHVLLCSVAAAIIPHLMKDMIDQERPDRLTVDGHLHGIPFSGKAYDAFPSGHALHVGAIASAAMLLRPRWRNAVWAVGAILVSTRIILLAHWLTDVVAGLGFGWMLERGIRRLTKPAPIREARTNAPS